MLLFIEPVLYYPFCLTWSMFGLLNCQFCPLVEVSWFNDGLSVVVDVKGPLCEVDKFDASFVD